MFSCEHVFGTQKRPGYYIQSPKVQKLVQPGHWVDLSAFVPLYATSPRRFTYFSAVLAAASNTKFFRSMLWNFWRAAIGDPVDHRIVRLMDVLPKYPIQNFCLYILVHNDSMEDIHREKGNSLYQTLELTFQNREAAFRLRNGKPQFFKTSQKPLKTIMEPYKGAPWVLHHRGAPHTNAKQNQKHRPQGDCNQVTKR